MWTEGRRRLDCWPRGAIGTADASTPFGNGQPASQAGRRGQPPSRHRSRRARKGLRQRVRDGRVRSARGKRQLLHRRSQPWPRSRAAKDVRSSNVSVDRAPPLFPSDRERMRRRSRPRGRDRRADRSAPPRFQVPLGRKRRQTHARRGPNVATAAARTRKEIFRRAVTPRSRRRRASGLGRSP